MIRVARLLVVLVLLGGVLLESGPAEACSCGSDLASADELQGAEGVYLATLESIQFGGLIIPKHGYNKKAFFRVQRVLKGQRVGLVVLPAHTGPEGDPSCGLNARLGETWVLIDREIYGPWSIDSCSHLNLASPEAVATAKQSLGNGSHVPAENRDDVLPLSRGVYDMTLNPILVPPTLAMAAFALGTTAYLIWRRKKRHARQPNAA